MLSLFLVLSLLAGFLQDPKDQADLLDARAATLAEQGDHSGAAELWRQVTELRDRELPPEDPAVARSWNNLSWALSQAGRHDEAVAAGEEALQRVRLAGDPSPGTVAVLRNLAEAAWRGDRVDAARVWAERAVADAVTVYGNTPMVGDLHAFAGRLAAGAADWSAAQAHLEQAASIAEHLFGVADPAGLAGPLRGLSEALAHQGQVDAALMLQEHALAVLAEAGLGNGALAVGLVEDRIGLLRLLGEEILAGEALAFLYAGDPRLREEVPVGERLTRAIRLLDVGRPDLVNPWLEGLEDSGEGQGFAAALDGARARLVWWTRGAGDAHFHCESGLAGLEDAPVSTSARILKEDLRILQGYLLSEVGREGEVLDLLLPILKARRDLFGEEHSALLPVLIPLLHAEGRIRPASTEHVDLLDLTTGCLASLPPGEKPFVAARTRRDLGVGLYELLAEGWCGVAQARESLRGLAFSRIDELRAFEAEEAEAWWWAGRGDGTRDRTGADLEEVRASLTGPNDRAVALIVGSEQAWGWVVHPDPECDLVLPLGRTREIRELASRWLGSRGKDVEAAARLSDTLLNPLWPALDGARSAVVVADDALAWLPLEALSDPSGAPWLLSCAVRHAPSFAARAKPAPLRATRGEGGWHLRARGAFPVPAPLHRWGRLMGRFGGVPTEDPAPLRALTLPPNELVALGEAEWLGLSEAGELSGRRFGRIQAPLFLDPMVPSGTGVALGPEDPHGRPLWQIANGFLETPEIGAHDLGGAVVWHESAALLTDAGSWHPGGLRALIGAWWSAGASAVVLPAWSGGGPPAADFDAELQDRLRSGDPERALLETQRAWIRERGGAETDPAVWARYRSYRR